MRIWVSNVLNDGKYPIDLDGWNIDRQRPPLFLMALRISLTSLVLPRRLITTLLTWILLGALYKIGFYSYPITLSCSYVALSVRSACCFLDVDSTVWRGFRGPRTVTREP